MNDRWPPKWDQALMEHMIPDGHLLKRKPGMTSAKIASALSMKFSRKFTKNSIVGRISRLGKIHSDRYYKALRHE